MRSTHMQSKNKGALLLTYLKYDASCSVFAQFKIRRLELDALVDFSSREVEGHKGCPSSPTHGEIISRGNEEAE